ncbi:hypothetical protein ACWF62_15025 [Rhodococcus sp. NPDC054953]
MLIITIGRSVTAAVIDSATGSTEPLPLSAQERAMADSAPQMLIAAAVARAAVVHARLTGVVTGPDALALTHPRAWSGEQVQRVREAAEVAGFAPDRVTLIASMI